MVVGVAGVGVLHFTLPGLPSPMPSHCGRHCGQKFGCGSTLVINGVQLNRSNASERPSEVLDRERFYTAC